MHTTRFFIACLIQALEDVHACGIIHKDVKPENLVFDEDGYLRLTDFGISTTVKRSNGHEAAGTPGYMAPEVICKRSHGQVSDFFSVGVVAHELMMGYRPYSSQWGRQHYRAQVKAYEAQIRPEHVPFGWTEEAADFIN